MSEYDFRMLEVSGELYALEDHLRLIEDQMRQIQQKERGRVDQLIGKKSTDPGGYEYYEALREHDRFVDCLLPRFFRGPFLIALYAVYESAVTEIAQLIQQGESLQISIKDLKEDFLERPKKYYKYVLKLESYKDIKEWHKLTMLSELRNSFAHANGRLEMLNEKSNRTIKNWEKQGIGISTYEGFVVCDDAIVSDIFDVVRKSLENLIAEYKRWDDARREKM